MNTLQPNAIERYVLTEAKERQIWQQCLFIFDTSSLLDFYYYSPRARSEIFNVLAMLGERIWIPDQVQFEYLKNREQTLLKPINEKYEKELKSVHVDKLKEYHKKFDSHLGEIKSRTKKQDQHPYVDQAIIDAFERKFNDFKTEFEEFAKNIGHEIEERIKEINRVKDNDEVLSFLGKNMRVGNRSSFAEMMEIMQQGSIRYALKIPPGYADEKDKVGRQRFGDLLLWKQTIKHCSQVDKPAILVCNDVKDDWCYSESATRIIRPREELIDEFLDETGHNFWMYTTEQFLYKVGNILNSQVQDETIQEVVRVAERSRSDNQLVADQGFVALQTGNVEEARRLFEEAATMGLSPVYTCINMAMVEILDGRPEKAIGIITDPMIQYRLAGKYMKVNIELIKSLSTAQIGLNVDLDTLDEALLTSQDYQFSDSPIRFLREGLQRRNTITDSMAQIFDKVMLFEPRQDA